VIHDQRASECPRPIERAEVQDDEDEDEYYIDDDQDD
jgi:hypothetical protein